MGNNLPTIGENAVHGYRKNNQEKMDTVFIKLHWTS